MSDLLRHITDVLSNTSWDLVIGQALLIPIALGGFYIAWREIRHLARQQKIATDAVTSQLYGQVSEAMYRVNQTFNKKPEWWKYFYKEVPEPATTLLKDQLENVCEMILDFVDAVVEQKRALPQDVQMDWSTWEAYFRFLYNNSPVLRRYVEENYEFYPDYFFAALGYLVVRDAYSGKVISRWAACPAERKGYIPHSVHLAKHWTLPRDTFPWIRTWIFTEQIGKAPRMVFAAVRSDGPDVAGVTIKLQGNSGAGEILDRELSVLQYWIIGTMDGTGVRQVQFDLPNGRHAVYLTRNRKTPTGTETFLIPEYTSS